MKANGHVWWCYASVRTALPDDPSIWKAVDAGYLEEDGGISDGYVTVSCGLNRAERYPFWRIESAMGRQHATTLTELGWVITTLRHALQGAV